MINGVQYVYVIATDYRYDSSTQKYDLSMRFLFYDVFGLDDDDVIEYGADGGIELNPGATWGNHRLAATATPIQLRPARDPDHHRQTRQRYPGCLEIGRDRVNWIKVQRRMSDQVGRCINRICLGRKMEWK
jgi:hypothetical protein